jgi:hypothetical protein
LIALIICDGECRSWSPSVKRLSSLCRNELTAFNYHKPTNALYSHWIVQENSPTCFEPSQDSSSGSHTITNLTHYRNMVTKIGHNLKCLYPGKMSLKLLLLRRWIKVD